MTTLALADAEVARAVAAGLAQRPKRLPSWLFYDARGSALFERITALPEYYLTRAEAAIFAEEAASIVGTARSLALAPLEVVELGAGSATKTEVLLAALLRVQTAVSFVPVDVCPEGIVAAARRLGAAYPGLAVRPHIGMHEEALRAIARTPGRRLVMFIGSSIGNLEDDEARALLVAIRACLGPGGALLLGTDLRKSPALLLPAYDDRAGVTAAFNRNVLHRINRELGGHFDPATFRHVALWNVPASRVEMHLESERAQAVRIDALARTVPFGAGERIHTESCAKYDLARVDSLLGAAALRRVRTWSDAEARFAVHLARAESG